MASNGIIHVLEAPLKAPPSKQQVGSVQEMLEVRFVAGVRHVTASADARGSQSRDRHWRGAAGPAAGWRGLGRVPLLQTQHQTLQVSLLQGRC